MQVRNVEQVMSTLGTAVPEQVDFDIPELCNGESVIFELTDSTRLTTSSTAWGMIFTV